MSANNPPAIAISTTITTRINGARFFLSCGQSGTPAAGEIAPTTFAFGPESDGEGAAKGAASAGAGTIIGAALEPGAAGKVGAAGNAGTAENEGPAGAAGISNGSVTGGGGRPMPDIVGAGGRGLGSSMFFGESIPGAEGALARAGAAGGAGAGAGAGTAGAGAGGASTIRVGASIDCSSGTLPSSSHSSMPSRQTSVSKPILPAKSSFSISASVSSRSWPSG